MKVACATIDKEMQMKYIYFSLVLLNLFLLSSCVKKCTIITTNQDSISGEETTYISCYDSDGGQFTLLGDEFWKENEVLKKYLDSPTRIKDYCDAFDDYTEVDETFGNTSTTKAVYESGRCE